MPTKEVSINISSEGKKFHADTEDILAFGAMVVVIIVAIGAVLGSINGTVATGIIIPLCGGAALAEVIKARKKKDEGSE